MNLVLANLKEKYKFLQPNQTNQIFVIGLIGTKGYNNPVFFTNLVLTQNLQKVLWF